MKMCHLQVKYYHFLSVPFSILDIADLILLCSLSSCKSSAMTEGLKLVLKILKQADDSPKDHLTVLCGQVLLRLVVFYSISL